MRKIVLPFCVVLFFILSSCGYSKEDLEAARQQGYNDGYSDAYDVGYLEGYNDSTSAFYESDDYADPSDEIFFGFSESTLEIIDFVEYEAVHYAKDNSGWHPEEAMEIVDSYLNGNLSTYSKDEFNEAIMSLYYFYDYFYCNEYAE